ncbi:hypothetical protein Fmac_017966 [Flemingia macrophylla]|uniref:Disease resistance protein At4g27190-like leucine-rich repeats domain-containing protein n=1 Tax=Flemingia macrophylla TaxID=520843 RepID=A0ABD1M3N2_9FABA
MDACLSLFNEKVLIPKLERLELSSINIPKIWSDQALHCFQKLLTLNVTDCCNLKYLMTLSMAGSLVNLQSLSLCSCEMMEDIFHPEDIKQNVGIFPSLKKMEIICMEKLNDICQSNIGLHSFSSLDSLTVMECHKLITIFPTYLEKTIQNLQRLTITNCKSIENIFGFGNSAQTCDISETNLHTLLLKELPSLVHIWKDDTGETLKYNNLQSIIVEECPKLKYIFPLSIANGLENLEILWVNDCGRMKQIVALVCGSGKNEITFKFPHLNTLSLHFLSELVSFYEGRHTLDFPSLKKLFISHWYKLEGFTTEIESSQEMPIVFAEKEICNLEEMAMGISDAEWLKNKYIDSVHRMHKLQILYLYELKNTEVLFWFLRRLPNIKSLSLRMGHMKRIWTPRRLISNEKIGVVTQLKELELIMLFNLEEIGFEHDPLLQRVERLVINECMKLKILASSSISLSYLKDLEVVNCRLMKNLMTCSTATSLVQLTTMMIKSCPMIVEIIENEEEKNYCSMNSMASFIDREVEALD